MPWLIPLKLFAGNALKSLLGFLSRLSIWQILCIVLALFCLMQTLRLHLEQRHGHKLEAQIVKLSDQLKAISTARNEQRVTTGRSIGQAREIAKGADERARKVENAPLPGNCATPKEVLQADL